MVGTGECVAVAESGKGDEIDCPRQRFPRMAALLRGVITVKANSQKCTPRRAPSHRVAFPVRGPRNPTGVKGVLLFTLFLFPVGVFAYIEMPPSLPVIEPSTS